jgi:hypothetical protein
LTPTLSECEPISFVPPHDGPFGCALFYLRGFDRNNLPGCSSVFCDADVRADTACGFPGDFSWLPQKIYGD